MTWGPFVPNLPPAERMARTRALRLALKLLCGERGRAAGVTLLRAEVTDDPALWAEAAAEFGRLTALDQRRTLSAYRAVA